VAWRIAIGTHAIAVAKIAPTQRLTRELCTLLHSYKLTAMLKHTLSLTAASLLCLSSAYAEHAPAFRISTLDGRTLTNQSLKGKVVVLDFWATWCGPCRQVSKIMQTLQAKYAKQGVEIVCVDVKEQTASRDAVVKYKVTHGYTYAFSVENGQLDKAMNVPTLPVVVILDKAGNIAYRHENLNGLEAGVKSALDKALKN
jgi:cytochrome c biogenesis protein CcmG/thiol:disulfide interchange protein DsbE